MGRLLTWKLTKEPLRHFISVTKYHMYNTRTQNKTQVKTPSTLGKNMYSQNSQNTRRSSPSNLGKSTIQHYKNNLHQKHYKSHLFPTFPLHHLWQYGSIENQHVHPNSHVTIKNQVNNTCQTHHQNDHQIQTGMLTTTYLLSSSEGNRSKKAKLEKMD